MWKESFEYSDRDPEAVGRHVDYEIGKQTFFGTLYMVK